MSPGAGDWILERELKRDDLGTIELGTWRGQRAIRRSAARGLLAPIARVLLGREARALDQAADLPGIVPLLGAPGSAGLTRGELVRGYVDGQPLHLVAELPADFFERLAELVRGLHALGVAHNDLHKEPNVLVADDGYPWLVDFQLASCHAPTSRGLARRAAEDLRHVAKHAARYAERDSSTRTRGRERGLVARLWMATGKRAYNLVTRRLLRRTDGEGRRPRGGPWPSWGPPVGPRG